MQVRQQNTQSPTQSVDGSPAREPGKLGEWAALALCLLLIAPMLMLRIDRPNVTEAGEARALAASQRTAKRIDAGASESLVPHYNGQPQFESMPGLTWLQVSFVRWASPRPDAETMIYHGRLASAAAAMLAAAAVFWAGHALGGSQTALVALLVFVANPLFLLYARQADAAMARCAAITLAVAAALWAIRAFRPAPSVERQFIGWVICGIATGAALLIDGPPAMLIIVTCVLAALLACPGRVGHLLGLFAAMLIGVLMFLPWAVHVLAVSEQSWTAWATPFGSLDQRWSTAYLAGLVVPAGGLIIGALPWSVWAVGAAAQPFSSSSRGARARLIVAWLWLGVAIAVIVLCLPEARSLGDALLIVPPFAVLIGSLFALYSELAGVGRYPRSWRWTRWAFLPALALLTVMAVALLFFEPTLIDAGWINSEVVGQPGWLYALAVSVILVIILAASARWAIGHRPVLAAATWGLWGIVLMAATAWPAAEVRRTYDPARAFAEQLNVRVGDEPLAWLAQSPPPPALVLYAWRDLPQPDIDQLLAAMEQKGKAFVIGPIDPDHPQAPPAQIIAARGQPIRDALQITPIVRWEGSPLGLWQITPRPPSR